jgi:hypothetical protein
MANNEAGQIGYRERVRLRKMAAAEKAWAAATPQASQVPQTEPVVDLPQLQVVESTVVPPAEVEAPPIVQVSVQRTPADIRASAEMTVAALLPLTDEQYASQMHELRVADPMLYAAVSDIIANTAATAAEQTIADTESA